MAVMKTRAHTHTLHIRSPGGNRTINVRVNWTFIRFECYMTELIIISSFLFVFVIMFFTFHFLCVYLSLLMFYFLLYIFFLIFPSLNYFSLSLSSFSRFYYFFVIFPYFSSCSPFFILFSILLYLLLCFFSCLCV